MVADVWAHFQEDVRATLIDGLQNRLAIMSASSIDSSRGDGTFPQESSDVVRLRETKDNLSDRRVSLVCRECLELSLEVTTQEVEGPPQHFPEISKETEAVLLEMCQRFEESAVECAGQIFDAYLAACTRLNMKKPKHKCSKTLLKELRKCPKFGGTMQRGGKRCIGGLQLKNG